jgi:hypothetical protein
MHGKVYPREGETIESAIQRLNKIAKINGLPIGKALFCKRNHLRVGFYEKPSARKRRQTAIEQVVRRRADLQRRLHAEEFDKPNEGG